MDLRTRLQIDVDDNGFILLSMVGADSLKKSQVKMNVLEDIIYAYTEDFEFEEIINALYDILVIAYITDGIWKYEDDELIKLANEEKTALMLDMLK